MAFALALQTLRKIHVELDGVWEVGQAYTALSRGVTLQGVHVPAAGLQHWAKQTFLAEVHNVDRNVHTRFGGGGRPADPVFQDAQPAADRLRWLSRKMHDTLLHAHFHPRDLWEAYASYSMADNYGVPQARTVFEDTILGTQRVRVRTRSPMCRARVGIERGGGAGGWGCWQDVPCTACTRSTRRLLGQMFQGRSSARRTKRRIWERKSTVRRPVVQELAP